MLPSAFLLQIDFHENHLSNASVQVAIQTKKFKNSNNFNSFNTSSWFFGTTEHSMKRKRIFMENPFAQEIYFQLIFSMEMLNEPSTMMMRPEVTVAFLAVPFIVKTESFSSPSTFRRRRRSDIIHPIHFWLLSVFWQINTSHVIKIALDAP